MRHALKHAAFAAAATILCILPLLAALPCCSVFNPALPPVGKPTDPFTGLVGQVNNADLAVNLAIDALFAVDVADPQAVAAAQAAGQKAQAVWAQFERTVPGYEAQDVALETPPLAAGAATQAQLDAANAQLVADLGLLAQLDGSAAPASQLVATRAKLDRSKVQARVASLKATLHKQ